MAFLDDLLTFDGYICEGRKLDPDMLHHQITSRRSWLSRILQPAKTVESAEPEYWLHTTAAGFPLVLPHREGRAVVYC